MLRHLRPDPAGMMYFLTITLLFLATCSQSLETKARGNAAGLFLDQALRKDTPRKLYASWPYGPFSTRGRDIVDSRGEITTWAGVNWPMSGQL